MNFKDN